MATTSSCSSSLSTQTGALARQYQEQAKNTSNENPSSTALTEKTIQSHIGIQIGQLSSNRISQWFNQKQITAWKEISSYIQVQQYCNDLSKTALMLAAEDVIVYSKKLDEANQQTRELQVARTALEKKIQKLIQTANEYFDAKMKLEQQKSSNETTITKLEEENKDLGEKNALLRKNDTIKGTRLHKMQQDVDRARKDNKLCKAVFITATVCSFVFAMCIPYIRMCPAK